MSTIHILLPVHDRRDVTRQFIEALRAQTITDYHLILIDDGCSDGTADMVRSQIDNLTVITGKGNWWWGGSLHQGYLWLKDNDVPENDIVLIINDDTVFEADFLDNAIKILEDKSRTLLMSYYYSQQSKKLLDSGSHIDWKASTRHQAVCVDKINCLSTRGLFFRVSDFMEIGGFYPRLLPHYASDYEFTIRAYNKGFKLISDPALKLFGDETTTGNKDLVADTTLQTLRKMFSIRSIPNPLIRSVYVLLACPNRWKLINLWRVWNTAFILVRRAIRSDYRRLKSRRGE